MLYEVFNANKESFGQDFFISRLDDEVVQNLNPKFELREYQKETLGRFDFYFGGYQQRRFPAQLLFHMATGSGKTLVMAANILQLYKQGYQNFIFFVNSTNIIKKTKDNFLNPLSEKYLFADKIKFGNKEVAIKEVQNFEGVNPNGINIIFTTIQGLHIRINQAKENVLTEEDFEEKNVVLISDEAHHLQTLTRGRLTKTLEDEKKSWEHTILKRIFGKNPKNILLEFTATIDLRNQSIREKYEDKIVFQYNLKQFRLDKYSKEIEVLQADLDPIDRAIQAVILSQYRRKIAEKYKIQLKPVILFKANYVNIPKERNENAIVSKEFKEQFLNKIKNLIAKDINKFRSIQGESLIRAFKYLDDNDISIDNFIKEIQNDFDETKCLSIDSSEEKESKQVLVNSLESKNNGIRAIFAVDMLNEGWDVLNLFDIVRLYNTRDAKANKPGPTTLAEAQLIGRGARYFPFQINDVQDRQKRKFDEDAENELRILEQLYYHSAQNPRYIQELKDALTEMGIMPERYIQRELFIKDSFKKTEFWKEGVIFINDRTKNLRTEISSFSDARIEKIYRYELRTGEVKEEIILEDKNSPGPLENTGRLRLKYKLINFGENVVRNALDKYEFYTFENIRNYFPHIKSIKEFISSPKYLAGVEIEVFGPQKHVSELNQREKLEIALLVVREASKQARINTSEFIGTKLFRAHLIKDIFGKEDGKKVLKLDGDSERARELIEIDLQSKDWYAQNEIFGTDEEKKFIKFINEAIEELKKKYSDIALLRNEKFFQVFDFNEGRVFEPDFVMLLKRRNHTIHIYQIFIEPKGDQFKDEKGKFDDSREGWKQKFLLDMNKKGNTDLKMEDKDFRLIGLPFYNEQLKREFEEALEAQLLK